MSVANILTVFTLRFSKLAESICAGLGIHEQRMIEIRDAWEFPRPDFTW